jgi:16S rRNA (uracil1498-N3)-methyltransferase
VEPPIFYASPECRHDEIIQLPDSEGHHAVNVMRLSLADPVIVVDGLGTAYRGEIADIAGRKKVEVSIDVEIRNFGEPAVELTLAAGLSAGFKLDSVIEKGTELGVKKFVPVITEKSKVRLDDPKRAAARTRRLEKVALAAIKQCRRSYRPDISLPIGFAEFLRQVDAESVKLIFHPGDASESLENVLLTNPVKRVTLLVGPESGFASEEVRSANQAGFMTVSLGPRALRTETAGPVACALIMNMLGELR